MNKWQELRNWIFTNSYNPYPEYETEITVVDATDLMLKIRELEERS